MDAEDEFRISKLVPCPYCHAYQYRMTFTIHPQEISIHGCCANCGIEGQGQIDRGCSMAVDWLENEVLDLSIPGASEQSNLKM
jgi:hypothetical protein